MTTATITSQRIVEKLQAAFPFEVVKEQSYDSDMKPMPFYGLRRSDSREYIPNAVMGGYEPHTLDDVVALTEAAAAAFDGSFALRTAWRDGHFVTIGPTAEERRALIRSNDPIFPRLIVRAGYDGRAFSGTLGLHRDLCSNLAMLQTEHESTFSVRHTSSLRSRMPSLINGMRRAAEGWDGTVARAKEMDAIELNVREFVTSLYKLPEDPSKRQENHFTRRAEAILNRLVSERAQTGGDVSSIEVASGWELYNAIQGYSQHEQNRHGNPSADQRAILALREPKVRQAESLVFALAS